MGSIIWNGGRQGFRTYGCTLLWIIGGIYKGRYQNRVDILSRIVTKLMTGTDGF